MQERTTKMATCSLSLLGRPVFDRHVWNSLKVDRIASKQNHLIRNGDRSNTQIHGGDANFLGTEFGENFSSV
jgi:hypothetical protein